MIAAQGSSKLSICARCQYRLFFRRQCVQRRPCQTSYRGLRPFTARYVSTAVDLGSNASQNILAASNEKEDALGRLIENDSFHTESHEKGGPLISRRPSRDAPPPRMRDQQRTFNFNDGHNMIQNRPRGANAERHVIDHNALGQPAEVVVLPSEPRPTRPTPLPAPRKTDEGGQYITQLSGPDVMIDLMRETYLAGESFTEETSFTILENWKTELLGKHATVVRKEKHLRAITHRIYESFTKPQLRTYIDNANKAKGTDQRINDLDFSKAFAGEDVARTAWSVADAKLVVPNLSEKKSAGASVDRARQKNLNYLNKKELADHIIRRVWNVPIRINEGNNGKIGIRLKPIAFDLIVNHRERLLKRVADSYGVKVEAVRNLKIIWVTSDLDGCKDAWKSLCSMADRVERKRIGHTFMDGHVESPKKTEEGVLNEIGKLTNTKLIPVAKRQLDLYYLGPQENDIRDAQKMLVASAAPDTSTHRRTVWKRGLVQPDLIRVDPSDHLPIRQRYLHWSRWSSSGLSKPSTPSNVSEEPQLGNEDVIKSIAESMRDQIEARPRHQRKQGEGSATWASHPAYVSRATLGQIIHPFAWESKRPHPTLKEPSAAEPMSQLLTVVGGIRRPLSNLEVQASNTETLQITLYPTSPPPLRKYLPTLQIVFNLDSSAQTTSLSSCRLITSTSEVDVMMPEGTVDVRVSNTSHLDVSSISDLDPTILSFITASNLDIWHSNQRLSTPNELKLHLPGHALTIDHVGSSTPSKPPKMDRGILEKGVEVDYIFTGLEHRSTITAPYEEGTELKYSIVEAGKIGGRREELSVVLKDGIADVHSSERAKTLWQGAERLIRETEGLNEVSR